MESISVIDQMPSSAWAAISNWPFLSCCICIAVLVLTFKRAFSQIWPKIYAKGLTHGLFTLSYLVIGLLAAIPKSYLTGCNYFQRAILGVVASGASLAVYHAVLKRLAGFLGIKDTYLTDPDDKPESVSSGEPPNVPTR